MHDDEKAEHTEIFFCYFRLRVHLSVHQPARGAAPTTGFFFFYLLFLSLSLLASWVLLLPRREDWSSHSCS